jgi:hypothetical protein
MGSDFFMREDDGRSNVWFRDGTVGRPVKLASYVLCESSATDMRFEEGVEVSTGEYRDGLFRPSPSKPRDPDETLVFVSRDEHLALIYNRRGCLIDLRANEIVAES